MVEAKHTIDLSDYSKKARTKMYRAVALGLVGASAAIYQEALGSVRFGHPVKALKEITKAGIFAAASQAVMFGCLADHTISNTRRLREYIRRSQIDYGIYPKHRPGKINRPVSLLNRN